MRTVTRIRPLIVEMPAWSVEVARAVFSARMRRPMRDAYRPCRFVRKSARPVRRASGTPRKGREQAAQDVRRRPDDVLSVLPLDEGGAREQLPEMQHLHAQVTLDRARHARAPCAPAILGADRAGIASARHDRDVDDWMRTIKAGRDLRDDARSEERRV